MEINAVAERLGMALQRLGEQNPDAALLAMKIEDFTNWQIGRRRSFCDDYLHAFHQGMSAAAFKSFTPTDNPYSVRDWRMAWYSGFWWRRQVGTLEECCEELEGFVRQQRKLVESAKYLILAATGPESGPTSWTETRDQWLEMAKSDPLKTSPAIRD